jgi:Alginate export
MAYSDWHFGPFFRVFVQLKSSEEEGRHPGPRPTDRKRLDFNQAFIDFSYPRTILPADQDYLTLRLGRQEIDFGDERLLAVREGPNARQSFDGARLIFNSSKGRVDVFGLRLDPWAPRIAGSLQVSGGGSSLHGSKLETFNPMFPAGYYYGGPLNELLGRSVFGSGGNLGFGRDGSHAEYLTIPVTAVLPLPSNLSFEQAAGIGVAYITAWAALPWRGVDGRWRSVRAPSPR